MHRGGEGTACRTTVQVVLPSRAFSSQAATDGIYPNVLKPLFSACLIRVGTLDARFLCYVKLAQLITRTLKKQFSVTTTQKEASVTLEEKEGSLGQSTRKSFDRKCCWIGEVSQRKWETAASHRPTLCPAGGQADPLHILSPSSFPRPGYCDIPENISQKYSKCSFGTNRI